MHTCSTCSLVHKGGARESCALACRTALCAIADELQAQLCWPASFHLPAQSNRVRSQAQVCTEPGAFVTASAHCTAQRTTERVCVIQSPLRETTQVQAQRIHETHLSSRTRLTRSPAMACSSSRNREKLSASPASSGISMPVGPPAAGALRPCGAGNGTGVSVICTCARQPRRCGHQHWQAVTNKRNILHAVSSNCSGDGSCQNDHGNQLQRWLVARVLVIMARLLSGSSEPPTAHLHSVHAV